MPVPRFSRDGVGCNIRELGQCPRPNCYPVVPVRVATLSHGPVNRTRGGQSVDPYACEKGPRPLSVQFKSSPAISSTSWTMRRRSPGSFIRMNALVSASPSVVARKSET